MPKPGEQITRPRLTPAQRRLLQRVACGGQLYRTGGRVGYYSLADAQGTHSINYVVALHAIDNGWLEFAQGAQGHKERGALTDAGRAMIGETADAN